MNKENYFKFKKGLGRGTLVVLLLLKAVAAVAEHVAADNAGEK